MENISTYNFSGNLVTFIGFFGILSTCAIVMTAFTKWFKYQSRK